MHFKSVTFSEVDEPDEQVKRPQSWIDFERARDEHAREACEAYSQNPPMIISFDAEIPEGYLSSNDVAQKPEPHKPRPWFVRVKALFSKPKG